MTNNLSHTKSNTRNLNLEMGLRIPSKTKSRNQQNRHAVEKTVDRKSSENTNKADIAAKGHDLIDEEKMVKSLGRRARRGGKRQKPRGKKISTITLSTPSY